jgi:hypothetical protein
MIGVLVLCLLAPAAPVPVPIRRCWPERWPS